MSAPDLGQDAFGAAVLDADDRAQQFNRPGERRICFSIASESRSICSSRKSTCARTAPIQSA
jgi:hypothetical protein